MTDTVALNAAIERAGVKRKHICQSLGLTFTGLAAKVKGESDFKGREIQSLQEILGLSNEERDKIFFAPNCD